MLRDNTDSLPQSLSLRELLEFGYFPNGLPPCFSAQHFAQSVENNALATAWQNLKDQGIPAFSTPTQFMIPKRNLHRRVTHLVNPIHQTVLSNFVVKNWSRIAKFLRQSKVSLSKPKLDSNKYRYLGPNVGHNQLSEYRAHMGGTSRYALHLDLQAFYPSVYTHSIEWAFLGKERAKKLLHPGAKTKKKSSHLQFPTKLDKLLRATLRDETRGLAVGPDLSTRQKLKNMDRDT